MALEKQNGGAESGGTNLHVNAYSVFRASPPLRSINAALVYIAVISLFAPPLSIYMFTYTYTYVQYTIAHLHLSLQESVNAPAARIFEPRSFSPPPLISPSRVPLGASSIIVRKRPPCSPSRMSRVVGYPRLFFFPPPPSTFCFRAINNR